jgi:nicotinate dehydrogenase subunit B
MTVVASRRSVMAGGALVVAFAMARASLGQTDAGTKLAGDLAKFPWLDSWIAVDGEGRITVFTGKAELGQGIRTAFIQLAADELDVTPERVSLVTADTARTPDEGVTAGSHSMQDSGAAIRNAAANVRLMLAQAAATRWGLPPSEVATRGGAAHAPDGRTIGYGPLAAALSLHVAARPDAPLKSAGDRRLIGRNWPRVDIPAKLTGGPAYRRCRQRRVRRPRSASARHAAVARADQGSDRRLTANAGCRRMSATLERALERTAREVDDGKTSPGG